MKNKYVFHEIFIYKYINTNVKLLTRRNAKIKSRIKRITSKTQLG
jgi:hypothetical protein